MEKPSSDLEKNLQKYFKIAAILILGFVVWKTFSGSSVETQYQVTETAEQQEQRLRNLVTEAVDAALNKRQLDSKTPYITELDNGYEVFIPKVNISESASLSTSQGVFEIKFRPSVQAPSANVTQSPYDAEEVGPAPAVANDPAVIENSSEKENVPPAEVKNNDVNAEIPQKDADHTTESANPSEAPAQ